MLYDSPCAMRLITLCCCGDNNAYTPQSWSLYAMRVRLVTVYKAGDGNGRTQGRRFPLNTERGVEMRDSHRQ